MPDNFLNKIKTTLLNREFLQWLPIYWIVFFFVIPFILLLLLGFFYIETPLQTIFWINFSNLISTFNSDYCDSLAMSLKLSLISSICTLFSGFFVAFFVAFLRSKIRYYIINTIFILFIISPIIQYHGINSLIGNDGIMNNFSFFFDYPIHISDFASTAICLIFRYIPIVYFLSFSAIKQIDISLIEAALDLKFTRINIFFNIIIKKTLPAILLSFVVIFLLCLGNFSASMGNQFSEQLFSGKIINLLSQLIFPLISSNLFLLFVLTTIFIAFYNQYFNKHQKKIIHHIKKTLPKYKCLTIGKSPIVIIINVIVILFAHIFILCIILFSFNESNSLTKFSGFSLHWYKELFSNYNLIIAFKNSFLVSVFSALISTALGAMLAISFSKSKDLINYKFHWIIRLPIVISEIILVATVVFAAHFLGIENNMLVTILGISISCIFISILLVYNQVQEMDLNMEAASLDLGANYAQTFGLVTLPTIFPAISSCFIITFVFAFNEFAVTNTIANTIDGDKTLFLSPQLLDIIRYNPTPSANALASIMIMISVISIGICNIYKYFNKKNQIIKYFAIALILFTALLFILF